MSKLKSNIKKLWTDALRSKKYEQGSGALCTGDTFCCLGVLCDLHRVKVLKKGKDAWKEFENPNKYLKNPIKLRYFEGTGILPQTVIDWAFKEGQDSAQNPEIEHELGNSLAKINDRGVSFNEIASIIEEQL